MVSTSLPVKAVGKSLGSTDGKEDPDGAAMAAVGTVAVVGTALGSIDGKEDPEGAVAKIVVPVVGYALGSVDGDDDPDGARLVKVGVDVGVRDG
jgi:hypothetical protein